MPRLKPVFIHVPQLPLTVAWIMVLWSLLGAAALVSAEQSPEIMRIRHFSGPNKTRVVLDMSRSTSYEIREINNPHRLAINLPRCTFVNTASIRVGDDLIDRIRCNPGRSRAQVVLDLDGAFEFKTFSLPAGDGRPYRVVLDIFRLSETSSRVSEDPHSGGAQKSVDHGRAPATAVVLDLGNKAKAISIFTVIIDPGHGGLDPGAVRKGTQEKEVVLDVSLQLARLLNEVPGYRAVLTRDGDYYPNLARRVAIAAEKDGDLFLSVHCNTHGQKKIKGMEVYFLSLQGATDREARELAHKENAADLVGLDSHKNSDDLVMKILMDMRMTRVLHESSRLANQMLKAAEAGSVVEKRKVKQAGFQVLRSLAMPSALVELAYLSNDHDLKTLRSREGRGQLAMLLAEGVLNWRHDHAGLAQLKSGTRAIWGQEYAVRRGDNLWRLASRHGTTIQEITARNKLQSRSLMVGQVLRLPQGVNQP